MTHAIAPRFVKVLASCRFDGLPVDNMLYSKLNPGGQTCASSAFSRISIFTHEPTNRPPTEAEISTMGKLIEEDIADWSITDMGFSEQSFHHARWAAPPLGRCRHSFPHVCRFV
jgi:hypothetical protein